MGSLSVYRIGSVAELQAEFLTAVALYAMDDRVQAEPLFLLEEAWVGASVHADARLGDHVSVDSIVADGQVVHVAVTDKFPLALPFRETGDMQPSALPSAALKAVENEASAGISAVGIEWGAVHTEIKLTAAGPRIIEINGRVGGGVTEMLELTTGYRLIEHVCRTMLGEMPPLPATPVGHAAFLTPQPPIEVSRVVLAPITDDLLRLPGVRSAEVVFTAGSPTDWRLGTASNLSRVFACHADRETVMLLAQRLLSNEGFVFT